MWSVNAVGMWSVNAVGMWSVRGAVSVVSRLRPSLGVGVVRSDSNSCRFSKHCATSQGRWAQRERIFVHNNSFVFLAAMHSFFNFWKCSSELCPVQKLLLC